MSTSNNMRLWLSFLHYA